MTIRPALPSDHDSLFQLFSTVIQTGDTFVFEPGTTKSAFESYWFGENTKTFVAEDQQKLMGSYVLRPNQPGYGNHVANGSYMVGSEARGKGIGGLLCEHSIEVARELGYLGMQFNIVVSTNHGAVKLWQKYGFEIIGTTPLGFRHQELGLVDSYIMYRALR